ncbi:hypothetical protein Rsub_01546 [Raphidocelis subcapitata]|uniref:Carotenoid oxygenase n=1 Tax=Raphidocelis subcapitata TaxID=307507 RepID=A0A2V0NUN6_9CHLO|nr:hypothetical protein Rsub_01546 [Raphidocelis subcapitata]|eukprot:GBF88647.1 hypothetical protein Rsub_01546 [Raphidocelis subcapitata]
MHLRQLNGPAGAARARATRGPGARPLPARSLTRARVISAPVPPLQQEQQPQPYRVTEETVRDVRSMYKSLLYEYDYEVQPDWVEGSIPSDLVGTYFRNGPGLQVNTGKTQRHTFDGDGMVLSFSFDGTPAVRFKNKFVRTKGFVDEQNCANTGVVAWGGRMYALYESGLPHELDPATLSTLGESTVGGQLETPVLAAHYRVVTDPATGARDWVAFSSNAGLRGTELIFYEFDAERGRQRGTPARLQLPAGMALVHDIAVTEDYYVVHLGPLDFDGARFVTDYITSRCSIAECLRYRPDKPSRVWFVPRPRGAAAGAAPLSIEAPPAFVFHHANAFQTRMQDGRTLVTLDTVAWDTIAFETNQYTLSPDYYAGGPRTQLRRYVFDLTRGALASDSRLMRRCCEFPSVDPAANAAAHRAVYCCADIVDDDLHWGPAQSVARVSVDPAAGLDGPVDPSAVTLDVWSPGRRCIMNEPLFVPRKGATAPDDGYVLVAVHDAATGKGSLAILDASRLAAGPVATIRLPHILPAGLHGSFSEAVFHEGSEALPKWVEPTPIRQI